MDITIVIDKSTFQSLSFNELYRLSSYYKHIITPVLTMEILGDLKKEFEEGKKPSSERVIEFANKLFPIDTVVNAHYKTLMKGDLLGYQPSIDGRPNVGIQKSIISETGQKGFVIAETEEEKSIYKWKAGNFSEADHELSQLWRITTTQEDLLENLKKSLKANGSHKFGNYQELFDFVYKSISNADIQQNLLVSCIEHYGLDAESKVKVFGRWTQEGMPPIEKFAPYAFHCLLVDNLFMFGLASDLIGTRPTNRVDLEYLYYLPFCNIFTSNDKVHKNLTPLLLKPYQRFITGPELKEDLKNIVDHLEGLSQEERKKFKNVPPIISDSLTFKLWAEYFDYPNKSNWNRDISDAEKTKMRSKMDEFTKAMDDGEEFELQSNDDAEFIVKKSYLSKTDPCYCGSGKKVIECCIPEDKFNRLAMEDMKKRNK